MLIERHGAVALVRLKGGKANAMSAKLLDGLRELVAEASTSGARAVVITGYERFFSGGLAIPDLYGLGRPAMRDFIDRFGRVMASVFACPLPVVAAINGHAIAGGCVLALQADVRLITDAPCKIGLNEVQLGVGLPSSVIEPLRAQVPAAALMKIALEGTLFAPADALAVGLVDEVVAAGDLEARALARAAELARIPSAGFAQTKMALRRPVIEAIARHGEGERERWLDTWFSDEGRARLGAALARLSA